MSAQWNVRDAGGQPVTTLAGLAARMDTSEATAAKALVANTALFDAAPEGLQTEAKAKFTAGGGNKPPEIATGSFVSWGGKKGRVDLIVTSGKVPGVTEDVEGTAKTPAARVVVYDGDGKATSEKVGVSTATLKRIPPIMGSQKGPKKKKSLVEVLADHEAACEEKGLPAHAALTGTAVKTVYDRGIEQYPGEQRTSLTAEDWAYGRVEHFVKVAAGDVEDVKAAGNDTDLLNEQHPLSTSTLKRAKPPEGTEHVEAPGDLTPETPPGEPDVAAQGATEGKSAEFMGGKEKVDVSKDSILADLADLDLSLDA